MAIHLSRALDNVSPGTLTLIGSGEMTAAMGKVHREVMARLAEPVRAVFLDTPAGFQLNADDLSARAVSYFQERFGVVLSVASFKTAADTTAETSGAALAALNRANYIFAGPGSPSYAVRQWHASPIGPALQQRFAAGAHVVFASSAAIAASRHVLPVYEIYKVGQAPHWIDGLDLLGTYGIELAIVPHWNNREGGTHDTRYAYMGEPRLRALEEMLPNSAVILGVDEYTACIIDLSRGICRVIGAGGVTVRQKGRERFFPRSSSFSADYLVHGPTAAEPHAAPAPRLVPAPESAASSAPTAAATPPATAAPPGASTPPDAPMSAAAGTPPAAATTPGASTPPVTPAEAGAQGCAVARSGERQNDTSTLEIDLLALLIDVRAQLRRDRQWALADEIRRRLAEAGIVLEDGRDGTAWKRARM